MYMRLLSLSVGFLRPQPEDTLYRGDRDPFIPSKLTQAKKNCCKVAKAVAQNIWTPRRV